MKYIKLFETMAQYESYMDGEPIFPNVSYTEDNSEVHFLKSKPLATVFRVDNFYESEFVYLNDSLENLQMDINKIDVLTGVMKNGEVCPDKDLLDYLRKIKFEITEEIWDDNWENILEVKSKGFAPILKVYFYSLDRIYFETEQNETTGEYANVGMGWFCGNWSGPTPVPVTENDDYYGLFQYLPG